MVANGYRCRSRRVNNFIEDEYASVVTVAVAALVLVIGAYSSVITSYAIEEESGPPPLMIVEAILVVFFFVFLSSSFTIDWVHNDANVGPPVSYWGWATLRTRSSMFVEDKDDDDSR